MTKGWRERLSTLRRWIAGEHAPQPSNTQNAAASASLASNLGLNATQNAAASTPIAFNLGIDFGTSFTKIAYRDVGAEDMGIVTFGATQSDQAMIPSVVAVGRDGTLSMGLPDAARSELLLIRYLKMRLADHALPGHGATLRDQIPEIAGMDLNTQAGVCALSSWFLASMIDRSQRWIRENEVSRTKGRNVEWSANVGVPVEYYDSPAIEVFRKVLAIAWKWAAANSIPGDIFTLRSAYERDSREVDVAKSDCHAIPEIAAAVQSFTSSREATPGIYVYFDIGGGTLDGVAFDFVNWNGERRINFYSGKVAPLGVAAIAAKCGASDAEFLKEVLAEDDAAEFQKTTLRSIETDIRGIVGNVVMTAKRKDLHDWKQSNMQDASRFHRWLSEVPLDRMKPLVVFLGGGGANLKWYQQVIISTHKKFQQINAGVPPYALMQMRRPQELDMRGLPPAEFGRFAVAHGLSIPAGETNAVGLPSQFPEVRRPIARRDVVDYADSKDAYD